VHLPTFHDVRVDLSPWNLPDTPFFVRMYEAVVPEISGNKAFKLWPYLELCCEGETILSWGGAYSNHLLALSAVAQQKRLNAIGIIRGDEEGLGNAWIQRMRSHGMQLHFVSRSEYKLRNDESYCREMAQKFGADWVVPEGGKGQLGIQGASAMVGASEPYTIIALPGGTGTTAAGIAQNLKESSVQIICLQAVQGAGILWEEIRQHTGIEPQHLPNLTIIDSLNLGRFGVEHPDAATFRAEFYQHTGIALDSVYGSKSLLGLIRLLQKGTLPTRESILYIHTGGLGPA
jgi:1-aminocyclopropane-1-carboxylate deaminase